MRTILLVLRDAGAVLAADFKQVAVPELAVFDLGAPPTLSGGITYLPFTGCR